MESTMSNNFKTRKIVIIVKYTIKRHQNCLLLITPFLKKSSFLAIKFRGQNQGTQETKRPTVHIQKNSEIDDFFFRQQRFDDFQTYFKYSLCLELLINQGAKGAKRSVKVWTTNFYKSFFQKYFVGHKQSIYQIHFFNYACF